MTTDYLIDTILPKRRVHLIAGASDAGKTRFLLPMFVDWSRGLQVAGQDSHPVPWLYVSGDRNQEEVEETIKSLGYSDKDIPFWAAWGKGSPPALFSIIERARKWEPVPELLVIEGFSGLTTTRPEDVRCFLANATAYCEPSKDFPKGLTIVGVCESPKMKSNEKYGNPRQRVSGVAAWGHYSSTIFVVENAEKDEAYESDERTIWVCTKNHRRRKFLGRFGASGTSEAGRLRIVDSL